MTLSAIAHVCVAEFVLVQVPLSLFRMLANICMIASILLVMLDYGFATGPFVLCIIAYSMHLASGVTHIFRQLHTKDSRTEENPLAAPEVVVFNQRIECGREKGLSK